MRKCIRKERGFTLIELLTIMSIIGILAAISSANYFEMKKKAFDREAQVALRMVGLAEEAYYQRYEVYKACDQSTCPTILEGLPEFNPDVQISISLIGVDCSGSSFHTRGSGQVFLWNS